MSLIRCLLVLSTSQRPDVELHFIKTGLCHTKDAFMSSFKKKKMFVLILSLKMSDRFLKTQRWNYLSNPHFLFFYFFVTKSI